MTGKIMIRFLEKNQLNTESTFPSLPHLPQPQSVTKLPLLTLRLNHLHYCDK